MMRNKPVIIGLNGHAQVGKDTVGDLLVKNFGFQRRAFADKLRAVAYGTNPWVDVWHGPDTYQENLELVRLRDLIDDIGWDRAKVEQPEVRRLLQYLGTEGVRDNLGYQTWINAATEHLEPEGRYVFTDARFPNELQAVHHHDGQVWRITRPGVGAVNTHVSDVELNEGIDVEIANDGTLAQLEKIVEFHLWRHPLSYPIWATRMDAR